MMAFDGWIRHLAVALDGNVRDEKHLPERAQQPVIDNLEETCHGEGFLDCQDFRRLWLWLLGLRPVLSSRCSLSWVARTLV